MHPQVHLTIFKTSESLGNLNMTVKVIAFQILQSILKFYRLKKDDEANMSYAVCGNYVI